MAELTVAIGGLRTTLLASDPDVSAVVQARYTPFLSPGSADWRIDVTARSAVAGAPAGEVAVRRDGGPSRFIVERSDFSGTLDLAGRRGRVALVPGEIAVESFLRVAYSLALLDVHAMLIHASCLVRGDQAYLFCGPSGSGKTTVARLSHDAIVLTDELPVVRVVEAGAVAHATPFWGELARGGETLAAPLAGIYVLHQAPRHALEPLATGPALTALLPNVLFFARESGLPARAFAIAAALVETVPCFDLFFRRDAGFWEVILDE